MSMKRLFAREGTRNVDRFGAWGGGIELPDAYVRLDETTAKWQDTAGTIPATTHGQSVQRWDNAGTLGGHAEYFGVAPTLDTSTMADESCAFSGAQVLYLPDAAPFTIISGQGFEVFVTMYSADATAGRGVLGKWGGGNEWILMHADFAGATGEVFGPNSYYARSGSASTVADSADHVLHGRVTTSDTAYVSVDGSDIAGPTTVTTLPVDGAWTVSIGGYQTGQPITYLVGNISRVRIYTTALTAEQRALVVSQMSA